MAGNAFDELLRETKKRNAVYKQLQKIIQSDAPDKEEFSRQLEEAISGGFPIDWAGADTLLCLAACVTEAVRSGLMQVLIDAGADVNAQTDGGHTPLCRACWWCMRYGGTYSCLRDIIRTPAPDAE